MRRWLANLSYPLKKWLKSKSFAPKGEVLHKAGKHQESVDTLAKAMAILGIN